MAKNATKTRHAKPEAGEKTATNVTPLVRPDVPRASRPSKPQTLRDLVRKSLIRMVRDEVDAASKSLIDGTYRGSAFAPDVMGKFLKIPDGAHVKLESDLALIPAPPKRTPAPALEAAVVQQVYDLRAAGNNKPAIAKALSLKSRKTVDKAISLFATVLGADKAHDPAPASVREEEERIRRAFEVNQEQAALKVLMRRTGLTEAELQKILDNQKRDAKA